MKIGVDASCWANQRGFGRFTRELLRALVALDAENDYVFFADDETARHSRFPEGVAVAAGATSAAPTQAASASGRRSIRDVWALTREVLRHDLDLFFFPAVYSYFPVLNRTRVIVTLHDVIADHHPQATFPNKKLMYFWKAKQQLALRQADLVLTVSDYSKREICDYFGLPEHQVQVTTEAASDEFRRVDRNGTMTDVLRRTGLRPDERFLLYVGGISPHKNLGVLVDAFGRLLAEPACADVRLVLVGDYERDVFLSDYPRLQQQVEAAGLREHVRFAGYVPDADLVYLYNAAAMLVFPSLEEGFGLPAVEAMACGTPVVASDRGSLPEILGDAGHFFDPTEPEAVRQALRTVLADDALRAAMRQRGLARTRQFTWEAAARKTLRIFEQTVRG
ncbi:MAG: glycosyltransferase family 1 protein [Rhodothermales bacterium]|nr:glycosyltransferase family 1 protein [Rhodothermales bacterium]